MADAQFKVEWIDKGREPQCTPNPDFPDGIDADLTLGLSRGCKIDLPYPAPRCGWFYVECHKCKMNALITTAGRPDDPRSVKLPCKEISN